MFKEYFNTYLISIIGLAEHTVSNYNSGLRSISKILRKNNFCQRDIFSIDSVEKISELRDILSCNQEYIEKNAQGNNTCSAALNHYYRYIAEEDFLRLCYF